MNKYQNGSEWRIWDLHFHSPSSHDVNDTIKNEDIVKAWVKNNISVVAITDHHIIDKARIETLQRLATEKNICVLPGIEFLSDSKGKDPIHFIGIFPEDCNIDYIWGQISNRTEIAKIQSDGRKCDEVYCHLKDTIKIIKELGGIVTIHAGKKTNSIENITHSLPHGDAQKKDIADIIDIFEIGKVKDLDDYRKNVLPNIDKNIPMIICSDNHNIDEYIFKEKLWIKADPSFIGLKQAINEPDDRFYVGKEPEVLVRVKNNKTKFIKNLIISTKSGHTDATQIWFNDLKIPISKELTAIIGNKGSGKSALADILGLCSDSRHNEYFQFLHKNKFLKKGFAERFYALIEFYSDTTTEEKDLDSSINDTDEPKAQYLPQNYFEKICNEIGEAESFRDEIEKVVFQYIPEEEKLLEKTFKSLIQLKTVSVNKEITAIIGKINLLNEEIINLEDKKDPDYKKSLISKLKLKMEELEVHKNSKPKKPKVEIKKDDSAETTNKEQTTKLKSWEKLLRETNTSLKENEAEIAGYNLSIQQLSQLKRDIIAFSNSFAEFSETQKEICEKYKIDISKLISISYDVSSLEEQIKDIEKTKKGIKSKNGLLVEDFATISIIKLNLVSKQKRCELEIQKINESLSLAEQEIQKYETELNQWNEKQETLLGSVDKFESIKYLKNEIKYVDEKLQKLIDGKRVRREKLSLDIYNKKNEIKTFYDEIKESIVNKLDDFDGQDLTIVSSLTLDTDFIDIFLSYISQNKSGSFMGKDEGKKILIDNILQNVDWNSEASIKDLLSKVIQSFEQDFRPKYDKTERFIGEQIKDREGFYDFIFSLRYLKPLYELQKDGKNIEELSPGEKGALLLVFYLVLDKSTIPLIIDQPEDNLDNNSVYKVLVPFIRAAKKRRQIIMVTHNPNLAVVADAEEIIRVNIEKNKGNKFSYISGSIEDITINKAIVDVLEGTMPAFNVRKNKYHDRQ